MQIRQLTVAALVAGFSATALVSIAHANPQIDVLAVTGDATPSTDGTFDTFQSPILNGNGEVAFVSDIAGSPSTRGLFIWDTSNINRVVRLGQTAPDSNGSVASFNNVSFSNAGVGFSMDFAFTTGGNTDARGLYVGDGSSITTVYRQGTPTPIGTFLGGLTNRINNAGDMAFINRRPATNENDTPFVYDAGSGTLSTVIVTGDPAPDGLGTYDVTNAAPKINDAGQVLVQTVEFAGTPNGSADDRAMLFDDGLGLSVVVREGAASPDMNGTVSNWSSAQLSQNGRITFEMQFTGTTGGTSDDEAIVRTNSGSLDIVARKGDPLPGGIGEIGNISGINTNEVGDVLYFTTLQNTPGGTADGNPALVLTDGVSTDIILTRGDFNPFGGTFFVPSTYALNEAGQVAFTAVSDIGGFVFERGLYFYDESMGLMEIAREGDAFLGSTIDTVTLAQGDMLLNGFNDTGVAQIAYEFGLADAREGIALWTIPEPTSLALLGLGGLSLLRRRRAMRS